MNLIQELEKEQLDKLRKANKYQILLPGIPFELMLKLAKVPEKGFKPMKALSLEDLAQVLMKASQ